MNYKTRKFAGFTLIELLVTIVIIGILATISIATFNGYFEKARLAKAQQFASTAESKLKSDTLANGLTVLADCPLDSTSANKSPCLTGFSMSTWGSNALTDDTYNDSGKSLKRYGSGVLTKGRILEGMSLSVWIKYGEFSISSNIGRFRIRFRSNNDWPKPLPRLEVRDVNGNEIDLLGPEINPDNWHHLLGTWDSTAVKFYLDGELVSIKDASSLVLPVSVNSFYVSGRGIDEIQIYPIAMEGVMPRSSSKIRTLADGGDEFDLS